jgi:late competence protein required for DNA uptake (superfamily II DNA/RNA helicase)
MTTKYYIVDTNVPATASSSDPSQRNCREQCIVELEAFFNGSRVLVIDDQWHVLGEYARNLKRGRLDEQFLHWVLQNRQNPKRCCLIYLASDPAWSFKDFPKDKRLAKFDRADRKKVLDTYGVRILFICNRA